MNQSKPLRKSCSPLKVVQKGPLQISGHRNSLFHGAPQSLQIPSEKFNTLRVMHTPVVRKGIVVRHPVFRYENRFLIAFMKYFRSPIKRIRGNRPVKVSFFIGSESCRFRPAVFPRPHRCRPVAVQSQKINRPGNRIQLRFGIGQSVGTQMLFAPDCRDAQQDRIQIQRMPPGIQPGRSRILKQRITGCLTILTAPGGRHII